jgi:hypothetical protein
LAHYCSNRSSVKSGIVGETDPDRPQNGAVTTGEPVYQSDPDAPPDTGFTPGALHHLVAGRHGRLLDPRRTPVQVRGLDLARGYFEVEILAFEDRGAHWLVPLEGVGDYQFAAGEDASAEDVEMMRARAAALGRPLAVPVDPLARDATLRRLADARTEAVHRLDGVSFDLERLVRDRRGDPAICALFADVMREHDVADLEAAFASTFVSNPHSGEVVKGHAIVVAELGLCPFTGTAVRDPALFDGRWSRDRRARHLIARMAFVQSLFARADVPVYRGITVAVGPLPPPRRPSLVSASFSEDVAVAHFRAGPPTSTAVLVRQPLPRERLFMTFVETEAMSRTYREAEAVLVGDPDNRAF